MLFHNCQPHQKLESTFSHGSTPLSLWASQTTTGEETPESLTQKVMEQVKQAYTVKASHESAESLKRLERHLILQAIDQHWQEYLRSMDSLRESIGLRAYGQRDPLVEYKREAYNLFMDLMERIYEEIANSLFRSATSVDAMQEFFKSLSKLEMPKQESLINAAPVPTRLNTMIPNQSDNNRVTLLIGSNGGE